jgi:ATP-binding cassette subfamily C protein CydD
MAGLARLRVGLRWAAAEVAPGAAEDLRRLRACLEAGLVALGPEYARGERTGERLCAAGEAVESLDGYVTRHRPARLLTAIVPVLTAAVVRAVDPWTALVLRLAGLALALPLAPSAAGRSRPAISHRPAVRESADEAVTPLPPDRSRRPSKRPCESAPIHA